MRERSCLLTVFLRWNLCELLPTLDGLHVTGFSQRLIVECNGLGEPAKLQRNALRGNLFLQQTGVVDVDGAKRYDDESGEDAASCLCDQMIKLEGKPNGWPSFLFCKMKAY